MKNKMKIALAAVIMGGLGLSACTTQADTVNSNLDKAADSFRIVRHIQFVNGVTDNVLVDIVGACSIKYGSKKYDVTCKTDDGKFIRNTITKSDNSFVVSEQVAGASVSSTHYQFIVRPGSVIPNVDVQ